jgi:hypothetical protein
MVMRVALIFLSGKLTHVVLAGLVSWAARVIVVLSVVVTRNARCMSEGRYYDISDGGRTLRVRARSHTEFCTAKAPTCLHVVIKA